MNKAHQLVTFALLFCVTATYAQLKVDAELRPRFEYRHGVKTPFPNNAEPATFVSQRTRLNAGYKLEKLDFCLSLQDVRVWGDVPQLNTSDKNGIAIHEVWANIALNNHLGVKVGRQEIAYDDQRIFGSVGWAQQSRSHDVAILKYANNNFKADFGFAFNQDKEALIGNILTTPKTYKSFQYVWLHKNWNNFTGSLLFLNNGLQYIDESDTNNSETRYSQTIGTHIKSTGTVSVAGNLYYQFGKDKANHQLNAYLIGLEANYKTSESTKIGLGLELQSGNDNGIIANKKNNAFTPFYGTNHKFNGFMDYFYVGNHANNIGLLNIYANATFRLSPKSNIMIALHNFSAAAKFKEKQLGNEVDLAYSYKIQKEIAVKAGYSHMFASKGMEILKGNTDGNTNNWGWVMLVIKPTLFTSK